MSKRGSRRIGAPLEAKQPEHSTGVPLFGQYRLAHVSETSEYRELGFKFPVALTSAVLARCVEEPVGVVGQDWHGRLWDFLSMLRQVFRSSGGGIRSTSVSTSATITGRARRRWWRSKPCAAQAMTGRLSSPSCSRMKIGRKKGGSPSREVALFYCQV